VPAFLVKTSTVPQKAARLVVKTPDHEFLPVAPSLVAGSHAVGQRNHHQRVQRYRVTDDPRKLFHGGGVLHIPRPRDPAHLAVRIHELDEHLEPLRSELEAARYLLRSHGARFLMMPGVCSLSGVVQQHGEIENGGILEVAEDFCVSLEAGFGGEEQGIDFFSAKQGVLVGGVPVEKLMLDKACQGRELGKVFSKKPQVVHHPEYPADLTFP
jgi:hypothetical protein